MTRDTVFSACRTYRYTLWRSWESQLFPAEKPGFVQIIGLNPSTADETNDDNTIRRCIDYVRRWGYGSLCMTNLFAFRATDPKVMIEAADPIGPENDRWLTEIFENAALTVAAWGCYGKHLGRGHDVRRMLGDLHAIKFTVNGHPQHPLYLKKILKPVPWK